MRLLGIPGVQPGPERFQSLSVGSEERLVRELLEKRAVEPFRLSIGLGLIRRRAPVAYSEFVELLPECLGLSIVHGVVGHHSLDRDPWLAKKAAGSATNWAQVRA